MNKAGLELLNSRLSSIRNHSLEKEASLGELAAIHGLQNVIVERGLRNEGVHRLIGENLGRGFGHKVMADTGVLEAGIKGSLAKHTRIRNILSRITPKFNPEGKIVKGLRKADAFISGATVPELKTMSQEAYHVGHHIRGRLGPDYVPNKRDAVIMRAIREGNLDKAVKLHQRSAVGRAAADEISARTHIPVSALKAMRPGSAVKTLDTSGARSEAQQHIDNYLKTTNNPVVKHLIPGVAKHVERGVLADAPAGVTDTTKTFKGMYAGAAVAGAADLPAGVLNGSKLILTDPRVAQNKRVKPALDKLREKMLVNPVEKAYNAGKEGKPFNKRTNFIRTRIINPVVGHAEEASYQLGVGARKAGINEAQTAQQLYHDPNARAAFMEQKKMELRRALHPEWKRRDDIR